MSANDIEELLPELEEYLDYVGDMPVLRHPLVYAVPYYPVMNAWINESFRRKSEAIDEAVQKQDWGRYIIMHERPYRLNALMDIADKMLDRDYWHQLGWIYTDTENHYEQRQLWRAAFSAPRAERSHLMSEEECVALAALPEIIEVWRGARHSPIHDEGISWTLSSEKAIWFANRFGKTGWVQHGEIPKHRVIAHFLERGESEIVAFREHMRIVTMPIQVQSF